MGQNISAGMRGRKKIGKTPYEKFEKARDGLRDKNIVNFPVIVMEDTIKFTDSAVRWLSKYLSHIHGKFPLIRCH